MERKNTMLLTVIAVATLLVAVVGATFAYYSVQTGANNSTHAINTSTGAAATVTYTANTTQLYLKVTAAQMAEANKTHVLYAQSTDIAASDNTATNFTLGTFTVTGAGDSDIHECTFNWSLTTSGTLKDLEGDTDNGRITISLGSEQGAITETNGTLVGDHAFSGTAASGTAKFTATGNQTKTIHGTASITNTTAIQNQTTPTSNDISGLSGVVTTFQVTNVACTAVAS